MGPPAQNRAAEPVETELKSTENKAIVVVEDDAGMRSSLRFLLESCGFAVTAFASPADLFKDLDSVQTDCAILDIHLPGPDGIEVYKSLKARIPGLPAVFITGHLDDKIRAEAKVQKAVALLEKPFSDEALLDAVGRALSGLLPA
jgi:two-component system response regulator FixJ